MRKFVNGRNGEKTLMYQETYDNLLNAFSAIAEQRTPKFNRAPDIFNQEKIERAKEHGWKAPTLGIADVTHLLAKQQRELLEHILYKENMYSQNYKDIISLVAGGDTNSEALNLLCVYMGAKYYWRDYSHKIQNIEQYAQSWIGRYSSGSGNGGQHLGHSGIVIGYKLIPNAKYTCQLQVQWLQRDWYYDDNNNFHYRYNVDGTIVKHTCTGWQRKCMSKVERDRIKSSYVVQLQCTECHAEYSTLLDKVYYHSYGLLDSLMYCRDCYSRSIRLISLQ